MLKLSMRWLTVVTIFLVRWLEYLYGCDNAAVHTIIAANETAIFLNTNKGSDAYNLIYKNTGVSG